MPPGTPHLPGPAVCQLEVGGELGGEGHTQHATRGRRPRGPHVPYKQLAVSQHLRRGRKGGRSCCGMRSSGMAQSGVGTQTPLARHALSHGNVQGRQLHPLAPPMRFRRTRAFSVQFRDDHPWMKRMLPSHTPPTSQSSSPGLRLGGLPVWAGALRSRRARQLHVRHAPAAALQTPHCPRLSPPRAPCRSAPPRRGTSDLGAPGPEPHPCRCPLRGSSRRGREAAVHRPVIRRPRCGPLQTRWAGIAHRPSGCPPQDHGQGPPQQAP